ncbi:phosphoribosyl-AMP cyclohydrolase [Pyrodictium occultum]|uniref:phosphoribosyl-AMP cyclohydrolase n=1 Tax=Pyrodictium occultum TaxID=2309 RepID=UPI0008A9AD01|nr:phosphoribosyl-AMP cyclohydrolase [Pyrodictium occultum]
MAEGEAPRGRLVPVAVVDAVTGEPLMLAYASEEALRLTAETGLAHFHSRSRGSLWLKGSTSGGVLEVLEVILDCDRDAAAYVAAPRRHVCHLGRRSCFHNHLADRRGEMLERLLEETRPYTRIEGGRVAHPLATWRPPPSPLLAALAASLLAERIRARAGAGVTALLAPEGPSSLLALLAAQRLKASLHLAAGGRVPESLGELDRVAVYAPDPATAQKLAEEAEKRSATPAAVTALLAPEGEAPEGVDVLIEASPGHPPGLRLRAPRA